MFGYWFLYRDWSNDRGLFYDGQEKNLKYCLNAPEAQKWYDAHKDKMVSVDIKRPPDLMIPTKIPLETKPLLKKDIDTQFLQFITKGNVSTRMEMILNKFMDKYYLWVDGYFYRREQAGEEMAWSSRNIMTLIMMKETILGNFRITPLKIPTWKKRSNLAENEYAEWDLWDDLYAEYIVDWQKYGTNIFWTYIHKLFATMLPESDFNWRKLQKWQLDVLLRYWRLNYIIWPRSWWKSLVMTWMSTAVLLKELTDYNERLQEFAVLYMGLSQKQNAPYMAYSMKMLNNLFTNLKIARKSEEIISIVDWDKKRNLEFITTNQDDPSRSRRTRFAVGDEADYLKWEYVKTLIWTPDSIVTLISTIDPKTQAGKFYDGWKNAYARQREYPETIEQLIHRIWTEHGMDKCESRKDIQRKIDSGEMAQMRAEFLEARPVVALHYTMDDVEFLTERQKNLQNETAMNVWWYEYMLAENYGEYATNTSVFTTDGKQQESPAKWDYVILGYDEAENWDYPGFAAVIVSKEWYWVDDTWRLSHDPDERFAQMKQLFMEYKQKSINGRIFFASDISRSEAIARELAMLWMPVNMKIRWWGNVDWKIDKWHYLVSKQRCTEMIQNTFFNSNTFHLDPKCFKEGWLVEEISHFKRRWTKIMWEHSKKDDQVSAMMACLFFLYQNEQLAMKNAISAMPQMTSMQKAEKKWHDKYQRMDEWDNPLLNLKLSLF